MLHLYPAFVTCLALLVYCWTFVAVARARSKYGVVAPATTGNPDFERMMRVQMNTVEQLVLFLPSLWIFSLFISQPIGAVLGLIWVVGRILYNLGYYSAATRRGPGFMISGVAALILLIGGLIGVLGFMTGMRV
ncbi:MAG TPA: MAPEG family protein [Stellaceae bacterium]|nr:MAPEG family protein [Stellaceae bacterium]